MSYFNIICSLSKRNTTSIVRSNSNISKFKLLWCCAELCCVRMDVVQDYILLYNIFVYSMCSLVVSVLDSPAVHPRSNPGSGSALLMSEKSQAVYYISSCHMLID